MESAEWTTVEHTGFALPRSSLKFLVCLLKCIKKHLFYPVDMIFKCRGIQTTSLLLSLFTRSLSCFPQKHIRAIYRPICSS